LEEKKNEKPKVEKEEDDIFKKRVEKIREKGGKTPESRGRPSGW
jgi:hypothetical protein